MANISIIVCVVQGRDKGGTETYEETGWEIRRRLGKYGKQWQFCIIIEMGKLRWERGHQGITLVEGPGS